MSDSMKPWLLFAAGVLAIAAVLILLRDEGDEESLVAAPAPAPVAAAPAGEPPARQPQGDSASTPGGDAGDRAWVGEEAPRRVFAGGWTAIGRVTFVPASDNSNQPEGSVLRRPWKFDRVCRSGECRVFFARGTLYGPSLTWLVPHGGYYTAKFPPVTVPCAYPRDYPYPRHVSGQSHDSYRLRWSEDGTRLLAVEHRQQTGCYPTTSPPDVTRWRATPNP